MKILKESTHKKGDSKTRVKVNGSLTGQPQANNMDKPLKKRRLSKKDKLLARLPEIMEGKSVMDIAKAVGYSPGARSMYRPHIATHVREVIGCSPEEIKEKFEYIFKKADKKGDLSNANRSTESLARINGMFTDKHEITNKTTPILDKSLRQKHLDELLGSDVKV